MWRKLAGVRQAYHEQGMAEALRRVRVGLAALPRPWWRRVGMSEFDRRYGTDTSDPVDRSALDSPEPRRRQGARYQATSVDGFAEMMGRIDADLSRFAFVDIGAGKGRLLMLAARYPFRQVIGVELSPGLAAIARANIARLPRAEQRSGPIACLCADATAFDLPPDPLVLYMFNPFGEAVMRELLDMVHASLRRVPRPAVFVYANPTQRALLHACSWLERSGGGRFEGEDGRIYGFEIFRSVIDAPSSAAASQTDAAT